MSAYYNEHDEFAAQWLRNLIAAGHIAPGDVDERSIREVKATDLRGYTQCHFFAGIGIWSHALRRAGWADDREVWTGSCPCQPFSAAGKRKGTNDDRHLWPELHRLLRAHLPVVALGEQVASPDGIDWLAGVRVDMERAGYVVGAVDTCAAGFADEAGNEGFHIRQRLYWGAKRLGHTNNKRPQGRLVGRNGAGQRAAGSSGLAHESGGLGHPESDGRLRGPHDGDTGRRERASGQAGEAVRLEHSPSDGREQRGPESGRRSLEPRRGNGGVANPGGRDASAERQQRSGGHGQQQAHSGVDWLWCRDGKYRPVESGTFPLAHEDSQRVGRLRAYGNALDAAQAEGFVRAWLDCEP